MEYRRICVAVALQRYVDFTPVALRQRELAKVLAQAHEAQIHVLSVDAPIALLPDVETTEEKLRRFVEPLQYGGASVTTTLRQGQPSHEIRSFVAELDADLLIIGSHSKRGPLDVGLGSTAAAVTKDLPATVIMVRPCLEETERTKELMIPRYPIIFPYG